MKTVHLRQPVFSFAKSFVTLASICRMPHPRLRSSHPKPKQYDAHGMSLSPPPTGYIRFTTPDVSDMPPLEAIARSRTFRSHTRSKCIGIRSGYSGYMRKFNEIVNRPDDLKTENDRIRVWWTNRDHEIFRRNCIEIADLADAMEDEKRKEQMRADRAWAQRYIRDNIPSSTPAATLSSHNPYYTAPTGQLEHSSDDCERNNENDNDMDTIQDGLRMIDETSYVLHFVYCCMLSCYVTSHYSLFSVELTIDLRF